MLNNQELSGYDFDAVSDEAIARLVGDSLETVDLAMGASEILGTWLSLRGILFATAAASTDAISPATETVSEQKTASVRTPDDLVNSGGVADVTVSALHRGKLDVKKY